MKNLSKILNDEKNTSSTENMERSLRSLKVVTSNEKRIRSRDTLTGHGYSESDVDKYKKEHKAVFDAFTIV